jgi:hypothetical protein
MDQASISKSKSTARLGQKGSSGHPVTERDSKLVMLRAERGDNIQIVNIEGRLQTGIDIPSEATVTKRSDSYFGPKLVLTEGSESYLLTAPGPDAQLLLWVANRTDAGEREGWQKVAEVTAQFADDQPQYDLCPECGEPMQTIEHQRKASVGRCPGPDA